ncbi:hypothetical protein U9M48_012279 [Paspalum notatum var. saurae]|uniref:Integrase catalytic domain-containing protein n=1 Tax=Paspalum notatum var. saurae TaxID=547442 RepID=A0AAQ3SXJ0_PASNO
MFVWTADHEQSFEALKSALSSAPVLALPDFSKPFALETDACAVGIGAVLLQSGHPLAFLSKPLGPRNQGLSTYEKEYLAILMAVDHWRHYLQGAEFMIYTDHRSLCHLNEQRLHTPWQQRVFSKLLGLQYRVVYRKGADNRAADALSRRPHSGELNAVSTLDAVVQGYSADDQAQSLLARLALQPDAVPHFTLRDGILRYKQRIWLGNNEPLQTQVLSALHSSGIGGHSRFPVTYRKVKQLFSWPGMKAAVQRFVQSCATCQQAKPDRARYPGLLQPLPVPETAWQVITMDFVEGLPTSRFFNCILVVVDKLTRYSHFIPLRHPFTALTVAQLFITEVYKLHGMPSQIISDRDRVFTSLLWKELFRLAGVSLHMSSAYHPQSDGQTERVNQCMETYLRCFVHACPTKWSHWLHLAEFWYNTSFHSALGRSPFEVLYGHAPRNFGISVTDVCAVSDLDDWLQDREVMLGLARQHLSRAQLRMKKQADKQRSERSFAVGDQVYLKLQPYVQSSLAPRANQKLSFKFFGPYTVESKIGEVAYKLRLPANASIHPVFHVSQLKKAVPSSAQVTAHPPDLTDSLQVPEKIITRRVLPQGSSSSSQVLVKWSRRPSSLATWETESALRQRFPRAPAWGQAELQEEGNVSTSDEFSTEGARATSTHTRRPSRRYAGPEWV